MASAQANLSLRLKLPHPYLTAYEIKVDAYDEGHKQYQIRPTSDSSSRGKPLPEPLHHDRLYWSDLKTPDIDGPTAPAAGDNSSWARARRTPVSTITWTETLPTVGQVWLVAYALITLQPKLESIRIKLQGPSADELGFELESVGLFIKHPSLKEPSPADEWLLFQGCFWQGAGSPVGPRPIWLAEYSQQHAQYPPVPFQNAPVTVFPPLVRHTQHIYRPAKPRPGSVIYSRYIPHLDQHFSMVALDYTNAEHLNLFHTWQNDPRVAKGWNETGTLDQHREYLRKLHEDRHTLTMLAAFDDVFFAYYEVYWAKEDHMGAHYNADEYDRGRHSLVGDTRFRGPHRVSAWWSSLMHYMFLDEPRTMNLVGEPKYVNSTVLAYDFAHGFHIMKLVDLPHKRSAFVNCSREKFFQLSPFVWDGEAAVAPSLDRLAKL